MAFIKVFVLSEAQSHISLIFSSAKETDDLAILGIGRHPRTRVVAKMVGTLAVMRSGVAP